jgi:hypothetical protein
VWVEWCVLPGEDEAIDMLPYFARIYPSHHWRRVHKATGQQVYLTKHAARVTEAIIAKARAARRHPSESPEGPEVIYQRRKS